MATLLARFSEHTRRVFARHRGRNFVDGAMAAAALVALADGDASLEEGAEVGRLMRVLEALRDTEPDWGVERYLAHIDTLRHDRMGAERLREKVIAAARGDAEAAALLIAICGAISEADGVVRDSEVAEIRALAELLGTDPWRALDRVAPA